MTVVWRVCQSDQAHLSRTLSGREMEEETREGGGSTAPPMGLPQGAGGLWFGFTTAHQHSLARLILSHHITSISCIACNLQPRGSVLECVCGPWVDTVLVAI